MTEYVTVINAHDRRGLVMARRFGGVIDHVPLKSRRLEDARAEAQELVGPDVAVVVPELGETAW